MDPKDLFNSFFVNGNNNLPLDERERHLASIVFPVALEAVSRKWEDIRRQVPEEPRPAAPPATDDFEVIVEATRENLAIILEYFNKVHKPRSEFKSHFPDFRKIRVGNIDDLVALGNSLHKDKFNCNVSVLVGGSVSALGGLALLACLFPPAALAVVPLAAAGGAAAAAGGGVVAGTAATELGIIKRKMTKAQKILKKDQKSFQPMTQYFEHTVEFIAAVDAVLGFQVMTALTDDLRDFANDIGRWNNGFIVQLRNAFGVILDFIEIPLAAEAMQLVSVALTVCVVAVLAHRRNCAILGGIILTHRLIFGLLSGLDLGVDVGRAVMAFAMGGKLTADMSKQLSRAVFHGVFGGVGLALDVINIALTSIDVHYGSVSKQGEMILNAAKKMRKELEFLEEVYKGCGNEGAAVTFYKN